MVLGTGEMSELTLHNLKSAGADALYVVSRNRERGERVAQKFGAEWISLDIWTRYLASVDILIAATSASHTIIHPELVRDVMQARKNRSLFMIDIAVPRNIDSQVNEINDVYLYNVDDLKGVAASNLKLRRAEIKAAEVFVDRAVDDYQAWLEQLKARPTLERFEGFLNDILESELDRCLGRNEVNPSRRDELQRRIRGRLLHPPLEKIKEASQNGGVNRYLEALQSLFHLDKKD